MRALFFHQLGLGSNRGVNSICFSKPQVSHLTVRITCTFIYFSRSPHYQFFKYMYIRKWGMKSKWRWHSDESTCLPPTWLGFKSRWQRHMWAGFVVANLSFTLRDFSLATLLSPSPQKPTLPNSNLTSWNSRQRP